MKTTQQRYCIGFTAEDLRQLTKLCEHYKDHRSVIIKRAIAFYFRDTFGREDKESKPPSNQE